METLKALTKRTHSVCFMTWTIVSLAGCLAPSGQGVQALGEPCEWNIECDTDICIPSSVDDQPTGWPDGMCTALCPESECGDGATCVDLAGVEYCLPACDWRIPDACREGYVCVGLIGACLPDCRLGWDCGDSYMCLDSGICGLR